MYATLHHATDWAARHRALLAALLVAIVLVVLVVSIGRPPRRWPSPEPPVAVAPAAVPAPLVQRFSTAAEQAREQARLRDLNTSGDLVLDNGYLPQRPIGEWAGPY